MAEYRSDEERLSDFINFLKGYEKELKRLQKIPTQSPEYTVSRTYLDWLIELPWNKQSKDNLKVKCKTRQIISRIQSPSVRPTNQ